MNPNFHITLTQGLVLNVSEFLAPLGLQAPNIRVDAAPSFECESELGDDVIISFVLNKQ